jgi:ABC-2 type transport system permease protein
MLTVLATIIKELLELRRDRAGLMVLLVMPMALVLIVSLVQDNVMQKTGEAPIRVLFVDGDGSFLAKEIARQLTSAGGLDLVSRIKGRPVSAEAAKKAVVKGDYQFALIIPAGTGAAFRETIRLRAAGAIVMKGKLPPQSTSPLVQSGATIYFDPAVQGAFRTAVLNALQRVIMGIEFKEQAAILAENFPKEMKVAMSGMMNPFMAPVLAPKVSFKMDTAPVLKLTEEVAFNGRLLKRPTAAQQNVPAWALFGMFFIVVPLSGSLIRERQAGTLRRLLTMPASPLALLAGKLLAYVLVCLSQFALMLAVGCYLLPLLGTSSLVLGHQVLTIATIAFSAALAATGYGIMVGTLAKSYEQASMFGAVSVVISAALGGIMIPVYVMPRYMQDVSSISPLAWGLNAFQDVFVRDGNLASVTREISLLLAFFVVTITVSWLALSRNRTGE